MFKFRNWVKKKYVEITTSIAFYPVLIGLFFLFLSTLLIYFDYSETGKNLKAQYDFLSIKDPSTARSIITTIAAGVISLTVFSFSMVMIVLNQAAANLSNRVLDNLIGNKFQQKVLGTYVGTIVFAFFLLSTVRDNEAGIHIPSLSTYFLILLTVVDIFLFINFLHYITQSVKYDVIISGIFKITRSKLTEMTKDKQFSKKNDDFKRVKTCNAPSSGVYESFNRKELIRLAKEHDLKINIIPSAGTFVLHDTPLFMLNKKVDKELIEEIADYIFIVSRESIIENSYYGFRQLREIAVKALSPGINDPGTALESLKALFQLFTYHENFFDETVILDDEGNERILLNTLTFDQLFEETIMPIWDYGKNDRSINDQLADYLEMLLKCFENQSVQRLLVEVKNHRIS